jgi:hypothetical protein
MQTSDPGSACKVAVKRMSGRVSGQWVVEDARILARDVIDNAEDFTPEEIACEVYVCLGADGAPRIIEHARWHAAHPHPVCSERDARVAPPSHRP